MLSGGFVWLGSMWMIVGIVMVCAVYSANRSVVACGVESLRTDCLRFESVRNNLLATKYPIVKWSKIIHGSLEIRKYREERSNSGFLSGQESPHAGLVGLSAI